MELRLLCLNRFSCTKKCSTKTKSSMSKGSKTFKKTSMKRCKRSLFLKKRKPNMLNLRKSYLSREFKIFRTKWLTYQINWIMEAIDSMTYRDSIKNCKFITRMFAKSFSRLRDNGKRMEKKQKQTTMNLAENSTILKWILRERLTNYN